MTPLLILLSLAPAHAKDPSDRYAWHASPAAEHKADCARAAAYLAPSAMYSELGRREDRLIKPFSEEWAKISGPLAACAVSDDTAAREACARQADDFAARASGLTVSLPPGRVTVHTECGPMKRYMPGLEHGARVPELTDAIAISLRLHAGAPPAGTWEGPASGYRMAWIPPGTFQMGARPPSKDDDYPPRTHAVTFSQGYFIGITEVTQAEWHAITGEFPSHRYHDPLKPEAYPADTISWYDAVNFANAASLKDGLTPAYDLTGGVKPIPGANGYRLPTAAEWERAAQGDVAPTTYAGGSVLEIVAWSRDNADGQTHPVCTRAPNAFGLCDMSGNVREWTWDMWTTYDDSAATDPVGTTFGPNRGMRGGSWLDAAEDQQVTASRGGNMHYARNFIGVRLVRSGP
jgi:sulfatase modifying factor 1